MSQYEEMCLALLKCELRKRDVRENGNYFSKLQLLSCVPLAAGSGDCVLLYQDKQTSYHC